MIYIPLGLKFTKQSKKGNAFKIFIFLAYIAYPPLDGVVGHTTVIRIYVPTVPRFHTRQAPRRMGSPPCHSGPCPQLNRREIEMALALVVYLQQSGLQPRTRGHGKMGEDGTVEPRGGLSRR